MRAERPVRVYSARAFGPGAAAQGGGKLAHRLRSGKLSPLPTFLPALNWAIHSYLLFPSEISVNFLSSVYLSYLDEGNVL